LFVNRVEVHSVAPWRLKLGATDKGELARQERFQRLVEPAALLLVRPRQAVEHVNVGKPWRKLCAFECASSHVLAVVNDVAQYVRVRPPQRFERDEGIAREVRESEALHQRCEAASRLHSPGVGSPHALLR
jgi:hypothetical protein